MSWYGRLALRYRRAMDDGIERTVAHDTHEGPLRVLKALWPEGSGICHHVLVHPPGGVAGGDTLDIDLTLDAGTHALLTTPGATRFYRSAGAPALQSVTVHAGAGARLEWLPLENIAHSGCSAENRFVFVLDDAAQMIGWDVLALGLPASAQAFERGRFTQHLAWPGRWLEHGVIDAADTRLLDSTLGLGGRRVLGTLWCAAGGGWDDVTRQALLDAARAAPADAALLVGATAPSPGLVLLRVLGHRVEPVFELLKAVRAAWRQQRWALAAHPPRIWQT